MLLTTVWGSSQQLDRKKSITFHSVLPTWTSASVIELSQRPPRRLMDSDLTLTVDFLNYHWTKKWRPSAGAQWYAPGWEERASQDNFRDSGSSHVETEEGWQRRPHFRQGQGRLSGLTFTCCHGPDSTSPPRLLLHWETLDGSTTRQPGIQFALYINKVKSNTATNSARRCTSKHSQDSVSD